MSSPMHVVSRDLKKYIKVHISESHNHNKISVSMFSIETLWKLFEKRAMSLQCTVIKYVTRHSYKIVF